MLGLVEIMVVVFLLAILLAARRFPQLTRHLQQGVWGGGTSTAGVGGIAVATPDWRYRRRPHAGALAELFGLGRRGLRWRQVLVLIGGFWLADAVPRIILISGVRAEFMSLLWPVLFVFCAITAVRSFQSGLAIAVGTGVFYSLLSTAAQFIIHTGDFYSAGVRVRLAVSSFAWSALTISALQWAGSGPARWRRMAGALIVSSLAHQYLVGGLFSQRWSLGSLLGVGVPVLMGAIFSALLWTLTFWVGETKVWREGE